MQVATLDTTCYYICFRSFSGVLLGADCRSVVYAQKVEDRFRSIERGGLDYSVNTILRVTNLPNFSLNQNIHRASQCRRDLALTKFHGIEIYPSLSALNLNNKVNY